jgi:protein-tyrosine-phosphatase
MEAAPSPPETASPFRVAFVCTGNRARSPFAAARTSQLTRGFPLSTASFGVLDLGPAPALPEAVRAAGVFGVDLAGHVARPLLGQRLEEFDLVLGFEQLHIATAAVEAGARRERIFLVTELADILARTRPSRTSTATVEEVLELVHADRLRAPAALRPISDPVGRSRKVYVSVFGAIDACLEIVATELFGSSPS